MGNVISLNRVRVQGTTLVWRGLRHRLTVRDAFQFAEAIQQHLERPGEEVLSSGFLIVSTREELTIEGWDMGPIVLTRSEAIDLSFELARSVAPIARTVNPS